MKAIAPGKIIISGEHAVVQGRPAVLMAVDCFAEASVSSGSGPGTIFELPDLNHTVQLDSDELQEESVELKARIQNFEAGDLDVYEICRYPHDLLLATIMDFLSPDEGLHIHVASKIPPGSGMGSSAASAVAIVKAAAGYLGVDLAGDDLFNRAMVAERIQHGNPSGADPAICIRGGCIRFQKEHPITDIPLPSLPMFLVNTGTPESTTGECVMEVSRRHGSSPLWDEFETVTRSVEQAIREEDAHRLGAALNKNHQLLEAIGVVPEKVSRFIGEVTKAGGAAKVCGAGAIKGERAGIVLLTGMEDPVPLCQSFEYDVQPLHGEPDGARIIS